MTPAKKLSGTVSGVTYRSPSGAPRRGFRGASLGNLLNIDKMASVTKSTFVNDLHARVHEAERVIASQNEKLAALRHLLRLEIGESMPNGSTPAAIPLTTAPGPRTTTGIDFGGKQSEIVLALVQHSGEGGTRPRDIAAILVEHKLLKKSSNAIYSHLSELKKKGLVKLKAEGLYVASKAITAKPTATKPIAAANPVGVAATPAKKAQKKRVLSTESREAMSRAQKARWAAAKKAKG